MAFRKGDKIRFKNYSEGGKAPGKTVGIVFDPLPGKDWLLAKFLIDKRERRFAIKKRNIINLTDELVKLGAISKALETDRGRKILAESLIEAEKIEEERKEKNRFKNRFEIMDLEG